MTVKGSTAKKYTEVIFLLLQAVLYILFLSLDITGGSIRLSTGIKYCVIILCFFYALLSESGLKSIVFIYNKKKIESRKDSTVPRNIIIQDLFLQAGLFFTVISDLFILILDYYFYGVLVFILVQQFYSIRLAMKNAALKPSILKPGIWKSGRSRSGSNIFLPYLKRLLFQSIASGILFLALLICELSVDRLLVASVFYFVCILCNTFSSIRLANRDRSDKGNLLYGLGMLLFLLCDINVGLFNLSGFINLPKDIERVIYSYSSILMWTFYAPSQVLIALSKHYHKVERLYDTE